MATVKPRVGVTLEPEQYDLLSRLAALQGRSRSQILKELLEAVQPALARVVEIGELYRAANEETRRHLVEGISDDSLSKDVEELERSALRLISRMGPADE